MELITPNENIDQRESRVVSFLDVASNDTRRRAHSADTRFRETYDEHQEECRQAGIEIHGASKLSRCFMAVLRMVEQWERHSWRLEHTLRMLLSSEALTEQERRDAAGVLFGKAHVGRHGKALSETEWKLVNQYRAMDGDGRHMIRTLAAMACECSRRRTPESESAVDQQNIGKPVITIDRDDREGA